ncbi:cytochrome c554/c'-like protein [Tahibacter aquaticus]|uniref:Cytochrome c554/c'-like protein n=1 Tax=Tahibacter aquaticus TaxID=520092 RepID=A0A4R6YNZ9_9GAMM|nr:cytochrome c family protein [Tahibacter aquaticus]TDR39346.1 cytochrome c554/c'-like protein [Tahibacter aquaticus]
MNLRTWIGAVCVFLLPCGLAAASAVDAIAAHKHQGVASCSNSVCHGASQVFRESHVMQNEFAVWQETDPHAKAYAILEQPASREIARKLGLGNATEAKICLDCHADNVPAAQRGERFQLSDGVGCEACHGGAEQWLNAHADKSVKHADNLAKGMYATDDPVKRAQLCLSCHMGTKDRMITHRIMGAGHPRLTFELDTFTWLGRPHYAIDADWIERKGEFSGARDWAVGQGVAAANLLDQLTDPKAGMQGIFPELVLFNCFACHKRMSDKSWGPRQGTGLGPGVVRLYDANLVMFRHVLAAVDKSAEARVLEQTRALHKATTESRDATLAAARRLRATLDELLPRVAQHRFDGSSLNAILADIEADAARGEYRDYDAAEQAAMAAQSVIVAFENTGTIDKARADALKARLDGVYAVLKNENGYSMSGFQVALKALKNGAL